MNTNNQGKWYDEIILQCNYPEIADVSSVDYVAKTLKGNQIDTLQRPFIVAHSEAVTLKVEPWLGDVVTWTFPAGPYPMPLRKIIKDAGNTKTSIQITY